MKLLKALICGTGILLACSSMGQEISPLREPTLTEETVYDQVKPLSGKKVEEHEKEYYPKALVNVLSIYDGRKEDDEDITSYDRMSLGQVFNITLEQNLNRNLGYYSFREYDGKLPYPGVFVGSLGDVARRKYEIVRKIDNAVKQVQRVTTVSAEFKQGMKITLRPTFDDISDWQIGARMEIKNVPIVREIITKIGKDNVRTGFNIPLEILKRHPLYFEAGYDKENNEFLARLSYVTRY